MRNVFFPLLFLLAAAVPSLALEDLKMPFNLDKLASRATETVDVTLDSSMLKLASGFLSDDTPDDVKVKKLVGKIKSIYVRSFEFAKEGEYSMSDVEALRQELKSPAWSRIVGVKSTKGENTEVYLRKDGNNVSGLVVIAAEPKELTIVHIDGPIDLEELSQLGGHMGIPKLKDKHKSERGSDKEE